jgi:hypothetical protein
MNSIDSRRKALNRAQSALRKSLAGGEPHETAVAQFLDHHAKLHAASVAGTGAWSFEDALLDDLSEADFRSIPERSEHSIAWVIWHIARIEDIAMNLLVAGTPQRLLAEDWPPRLNVPDVDSGNETDAARILALSRNIDLAALRAYRAAVGTGTRAIVGKLKPGDLEKKVEEDRLDRVMSEGALLEAAAGIRQYWSRRTIAGLLLMPASRHILTHLNEALQIKRVLVA